ncbi:MAG: inner membrane protein [Acidobacteriota bacterium]|jgi:inner membrane protein|nr:inner membrane protein [Acidobacteriota bacterium]
MNDEYERAFVFIIHHSLIHRLPSVDNLTHSLVGLAAAKAGLERRTPYATVVCVVAANLPDIDIVALVKGPSFYLANHRGLTHSLVGTFALAVAFPLLFFAAERISARVRGQKPRASLKGLLVCSLLLSATHPLLDWTNSYGLRPFLPWDARWIYGDLLFIVDPWVWLVLGGACFLLTATTRWRVAAWGLLALVGTILFFRVSLGTDSGVPRLALGLWSLAIMALFVMHMTRVGARVGAQMATGALVLVVVYCGALALVHTRARAKAEQVAGGLAASGGERVLRVAATPVLADPLTWRCFAETDRATSRFDLRLGGVDVEEPRDLLSVEKPEGLEAELVKRAAADERARVLLDFARFPSARVVRGAAGGWVVEFADLRFTEPGSRARVGGFALDVPVSAP